MNGKIRNFDEVATTESRRAAFLIAEAGLAAIDTEKIVRAALGFSNGRLLVFGKEYPLAENSRVVVIGVGKSALPAAAIVEDVLGDAISGGAVIDVKPEKESRLRRIRYFRGTHPFPSDANVRASAALRSALEGLAPSDLVIALVSGGGSTLLCLPRDGASCSEEKQLLRALFDAGATIEEINTVRKHSSLVRGGFLAKYAYPAGMVALIFSDVPGGAPEFIASGPTMRDTTSVADALGVIEKYDVRKTCVVENCGMIETPKEERYFEKVKNVLAVDNAKALQSMKAKAEELGFKAELSPLGLSGEAKFAAKTIAEKLHGASRRTAFLYGGETVVKIERKKGGEPRAPAPEGSPGEPGGRNQELALAALRDVGPDELILPIASDGRDNSEYAGAVADAAVRSRAAELQLDIESYLAADAPLPFFKKAGGLVVTGDTGSNVSDLLVAIKN